MYFLLLTAFIIGVSAGAFTVNGLSSIQRDELTNYFQGFLQLLDNQKVDSGELLRISLTDNFKLVIALWVLGLTIIGIPFIFLLMGLRGFLTGFSSGFIIEAIGTKGALFSLLVLFPKELIIVPCIIALGVNGINFSMNIMKNKSTKLLSKESLRTRFVAYSFVTLFYSCFIFFGGLVEAYITPIVVRIIAPFVSV
jgi:stage II sporulation protein M